jgi:cytidylate kinase
MSNKKTIQVTVSGTAGTGKTTVALLISEMLAAMGFEGDVELNEYSEEQKLRFKEHGPEQIEAVKQQSKILVKEVQAIRSFF